jgi:arylsulfatase A-like enzyme
MMARARRGRLRVLSVLLPLSCVVVGSGSVPAPPWKVAAIDTYGAIRLANLFRPIAAAAPPAAGTSSPWAEWVFAHDEHGTLAGGFHGAGRAVSSAKAAAAPGPLLGWQAGEGCGPLRRSPGGLGGRTHSFRAVLYLAEPVAVPAAERLFSVEVRARVPAGGRLSLGFAGSRRDLERMLEREGPLTWPMSTPLIGDQALRTYVLTSPLPIDAAQARHVVLRPTDRAGASFEIASIRLVFAREALVAIPSGVGWYGLDDVYQTAIAARAPQRLGLRVTLPPNPALELSVGTGEDGAATFAIAVQPHAGQRAAPRQLRRTVTTANHWEPVTLDLSDLSGNVADITLSLEGRAGMIGFWGNPVMRSHPSAVATGAPVLPPQPPAGFGEPVSPAWPPQGVILVVADSLRRDHLDAYGYGRATAPTLAEMAGHGVRFADCVSQASWTKVSVTSLLTSLYPSSHRVLDFSDRLSPAIPTLPRVLFDAGYATLSLSSILLTGRFSNLHLGFEEVRESSSFPDRGSSKTAHSYVQTSIDWLAWHRLDRFFIFLHLYDPHDPYRPAPPYDTRWQRSPGPTAGERKIRQIRRAIADPLLQRFTMPTAGELARAGVAARPYVEQEEDWYDGSILGMDAELRRLLERLQELGLDRRTLVVVTSDHGEEFMDHGRSFHGQSLYGELTGVPLIFWWPGVLPAGRVVPDTVELIDVLPTVLELSGLPAPLGIDGISLAPLLGLRQALPGGRRQTAPRAAAGWTGRPAFSEKAAVREILAPPPRATAAFAIVADGWKLVDNTRRAAGTSEYELFDHRRDPLDLVNLAAREPLVVEGLARRLRAWRFSVHSAAGAARTPVAAEPVNHRDLDRLRALGYLSP